MFTTDGETQSRPFWRLQIQMNFYKISRTDLQNLIQSMKLQFWLIKTNLKNYLIRFIYIFVALVITVFSFSVPSFADSLTPLTIENQPIESYYPDPGWLYSLGTLSNSDIECTIVGSSDNTYYCFVYNDFAYFISESGSSDAIWVRGNGSNNTNFNLATLDSTYNLYYVQSQSILTGYTSLYVPSFNSLDDGLAYIRNYIDNGGSSTSNYSDTFTLNPGQVAYIGFPASANYSISANTTMPKLSTGGGWSDSPQMWYLALELPSSGTSFPISGSNKIPWSVVGSTNIFGQGVEAHWEVSNTMPLGYRFFYIYNPWYYQQAISSPSIYSSDGNLTINTNPISITVENYSAIRIYNLQQSVTGEGVYISNSTSGFTDYTEVIPSEESGTGNVEYQQYVDGTSSGDPSIINGTNNNQYNPNPMTVTEHIQQVTQVLSNFANSLIELIKAPISHVANLIQAGSGFMSSLRGIYAWLPVDIQGLVTSALTLVIGIGVFKVFL